MEGNGRVDDKKLLIAQSHLKDKVVYKFILLYFHFLSLLET